MSTAHGDPGAENAETVVRVGDMTLPPVLTVAQAAMLLARPEVSVRRDCARSAIPAMAGENENGSWLIPTIPLLRVLDIPYTIESAEPGLDEAP